MLPIERFFHPVLAARKLRARPVRVEVDGRAYVLFRDGTGQAAAFVDACPHRKAPLSAGRVRADGRLECSYHGWHFDAQGRGVAPSQPSLRKCDATTLQLVEKSGYLWLAGMAVPRSTLPAVTWPDYTFAGAFSLLFDAPLHVALDNFSEDDHTPWVHTRLGWDAKDLDTVEFEAENFDDRTEVVYRARQRTTAFGPIIGIKRGDIFHNEWVTRFDPVRTIYDIYWSDPKGGKSRGVRTRSAIFMVPETPETTRFHVFVGVKIESRRYRLIAPIVRAAAVGLSWWEVRDDQKFIPTVADTPFDMKGMRLTKYDKPLVHNHKLLHKLYWANEGKVLPISEPRRV